MSNAGTPNKSSVGLLGQKGGGLQAGSSGSGSGAGGSGSSSGTSGSNGQSSNVGVIAGAHDQAAAGPVAGAAAMVDLNRSIRTPKLYYPKKTAILRHGYVIWNIISLF